MTGSRTVLCARPRDGRPDAVGRRVAGSAQEVLGIDIGRVTTATAYYVRPALGAGLLEALTENALGDAVLQHLAAGEPTPPEGAKRYLAVDRLPGVADDRALTLKTVLGDLGVGTAQDASVHVRDVYWFVSELDEDELRAIAHHVLGNPLVEAFRFGAPEAYEPFRETPPPPHRPEVTGLRLPENDVGLLTLSADRLLSLSLEEMRAIRAHFRDPAVRAHRRAVGLGEDPTDAELEILAQTWSEHCKHKEFRGLIEYRDRTTDEVVEVDSLFATYIQGATQRVAETLDRYGHRWLLKVFDDNAGVVRYDADRVFVWKVETHNSPSALDPYGGAITGILGCNRDPFGTGIGGGRLLFNTDVLCFGRPDHDAPLLRGQLHPRRVLRGVWAGIEDGGNQCGVPTVDGAVLFDDRYAGKPLVFCGSGSLAPDSVDGRAWWVKQIEPGDRIVMAGGRVGRDGIHGATFSSTRLDASSPRSAVQIGSPITQKLLFDFVDDACRRGWIRCSTDNGAGGLSSSVGELATLVGGAEVDTARVPLKVRGLDPWEIFVSESQERMTLVVPPENLQDVLELAAFYETEATDIGEFTPSGQLVVRHGDRPVACLSLDFLHDGVPRKRLIAEWRPANAAEPHLPEEIDHDEVLERLLADWAICSREAIVRRYDHEVQGGTVIKPLMGPCADGPQDAAVLQPDPGSVAGIAISNGIGPQYGDLDPYHAAAGALDEAVRAIVAVGGRLPGPEHALFWSVNDNFCMPNVAYDEETNPEGKARLAALVRMCRATYDVATAYGVPLTSGKDSMKNDFHVDGETISVPPTVLFSAAAGLGDVRRAVTTDWKAPGDRIYVLGETYDELGASAFYRLFGELGANVPVVRLQRARELYARVAEATAFGWLASCHDLSEGGLIVALAESAIGGRLGCRIALDAIASAIGAPAALYAESHSRFVASVRPEDASSFESLLGERAYPLGEVTAEPQIRVALAGTPLIDAPLDRLIRAWKSGLSEVL